MLNPKKIADTANRISEAVSKCTEEGNTPFETLAALKAVDHMIRKAVNDLVVEVGPETAGMVKAMLDSSDLFGAKFAEHVLFHGKVATATKDAIDRAMKKGGG